MADNSAQLLSAKAIMVEEEEMEMEVFNGEEHQERPSDDGDESEVQEDKDSLLTPDHDDTAITQSTSIKSKIKLRRELNLLTTVMIIVGHIIGSGIFITPTRVLQLSGSFGLALILWTLGGFISLLGGLTYVELTTFIKNSGAEYAFLKEAYSFNGKHAITRVIGNLVGYLFFWMYSLVGTPASNAVISLTFGRYLSQALNGGNSPPVLAVKILAISAILFGVFINLYSLKATALFINVTSFSKILALIFISILGIWQLIKGDHLDNFTESFKDTNPCAGEVVLAFYSILYSYSGWYAIAYTNEENTNIERNAPLGISIGVPIVIVCYLFVNVAYFAALSKASMLSSPATALTFAHETIGSAGLVIIPLLVAISTLGAVVGNVFTTSRSTFSASRDGNFISIFGVLHNRFHTPITAILLQGVMSCLYIIIGNISLLIDGNATVTWILYGLVFAGLLIMRITKRHERRPFKIWFIVPLFMILVSAFLVVVPIILVPNERPYLLLAICLVLLGIPFYFIFIFEFKYRPQVFKLISDKVMYVTNIMFDSTFSDNLT